MGIAELPGWAEIFQQGWGRNAVACLFSKRPSHELLRHVRRCCRKDGDPAVVGYCWPKLLDAILANSRDLAEPFMEGMDAVLLESAASPDAWQVYGRPMCRRDRELGPEARKVLSVQFSVFSAEN